MKEQLLIYVRNHWSKFGLEDRPTEIDFFVKNKYRKLTFFFLEKNQKKPFALAKSTPFPRDKNEIIKEYKILSFVNSKVKGKLKKTIPKPISLVKVGNSPVLFQNFLPGEIISSKVNDIFKIKHLNKNFKKVNDWLIAFNNCFKKKSIYLNDKQIKKLIIGPIHKSISLDKTLSKKDFKWIFNRIELLKKTPLYLIPKHTDFWPGNILINKNEIKVLDWEDFGLSNLPFFDLFHFIVSYFLLIDFYFTRDEYHKFYKIFFTKNKYNNYIRKYVKDYCKAFNLNPKLLDLFFLLYLVEFYNLRHKQEGPYYGVTIRSNKFIKFFLEHRNNFILKDLK